jgi:hypothetical protein
MARQVGLAPESPNTGIWVYTNSQTIPRTGSQKIVSFQSTQAKLSAPIRIKQALELLKQRGVTNDYCPRCNTFDWIVDINDIPVNSAMAQPALPPLPLGGQYFYNSQPAALLSVLSIVCKNCGYSIFHNMGILGV